MIKSIALLTILLLPVLPALAEGSQEGSPPPAEGNAATGSAPEESRRGSTGGTDRAGDDASENPPLGETTRRLLEASSLRPFPERVPSVDFTLSRLEGGSVSLSDYAGSVVLLNFWATWCPPCREELPSMVRLQEELGSDNFTILAVSLREERDVVESFMDEHDFELPVLLDPSGSVGMQYGVRGIPTSYVVDREGRVVGMLVGAREWDAPEVKELIRHLASE